MTKNDNSTYDFVFIGLGAGNSLILLDLIKNGLTKNKQIAIFEAASKSVNDKTYCFWAANEDPIVTDLQDIISHSFNQIKVNESNVIDISNQPYHYIRSVDLYEYTSQKINLENITIFRMEVDSIIYIGELYSVYSKDKVVKTNFIFDSRPPTPAINNSNDLYLSQSFYGLHVKSEKSIFNDKAFEMMNFQVDQDGFTQFIYLIPFSENEALVELTRFGDKIIDTEYATVILDKFISSEYGNYTIIGEETGCIPMTTFVHPNNKNKGILHTGASANLIKPSTGYGFKNMHSFSNLVSKKIASGNLKDFNKIGIQTKERFKFYDRLLLLILLNWPAEGKRIFSRLYLKNSILLIFSFLDEKTTIKQEIKIFSTLPIFIFLKALILNCNTKKRIRYFLATIIFLLFNIISYWNNEYAINFSYFSVSIGLLLIGIPHGALDHELLKNKKESLFVFIVKYLLIAFFYYLLWCFFPLISLLLFICYSAFHFGESEYIEMGEKMDSVKSYINAFLLGFTILIFIISSHLTESLDVISNFILIPKLSFEDFSYFAGFTSFTYIAIQGPVLKKPALLGLLFLLTLASFLPLFLAFGFYFILQHSVNAWGHLKIGLKMNHINLYKKSALYTFGALIILILIIIKAKDIETSAAFMSNFFIFIACISLPHFFIMHLFYKKPLNK